MTIRVAEVGSLWANAKMATIFSGAYLQFSRQVVVFARIENLHIWFSMIRNIFHVKVHFWPTHLQFCLACIPSCSLLNIKIHSHSMRDIWDFYNDKNCLRGNWAWKYLHKISNVNTSGNMALTWQYTININKWISEITRKEDRELELSMIYHLWEQSNGKFLCHHGWQEGVM